MSLGDLQSALYNIYQNIPKPDCEDQLSRLALSQKGYSGYIFSLFSSAPIDNLVASYLRTIEKLFQDKVQELLPLLNAYETFLKQMCEENIVDPADFKMTVRTIDGFFQSVHPFLVLLGKYRRGVLPEMSMRNVAQLFSRCATPEPFLFKSQSLLCRVRAIMALEGLYQGALPYDLLKKVSRNYLQLWEKAPQDTRYDDQIFGIIKQIDANAFGANWIRTFIRGLRALVEHFQVNHHVEGTAKASLDSLKLAFFVVSHKMMPTKSFWLYTHDVKFVGWRKNLKKGMKLHLNGEEIILGKRLKGQRFPTQKRVDDRHIFPCENIEDKVVVIPQNQAVLSLIPLFRNTGIPIYAIHAMETKGRFALIERLYPLKHALELHPLTHETRTNHPVIVAFDDLTIENKQPSNLDELLMVDKEGKFKAIVQGEMIALDRETLEKVVWLITNNNLDQYRLFLQESITMKKLHMLCTDLMMWTFGLKKGSQDEIHDSWSISDEIDCIEFCGKIKKLKTDVHHELLKHFDLDTINLNNETISKIIIDAFYYLRTAPHLDQFLSFVCAKFIKLSKESNRPFIIFQFEAPY